MIELHEATLRQIQAADPCSSTWLSANAGSGKTRVLTDRVARLLLSGTPPQNILCLTFTKAAAGEMQNRLFSRLGQWAMRPDEDLRNDLAQLGVVGDLDLNGARRLFARAIETPGGLKIQTIHSFCSTILRQFPLEARVSPDFAEMDESAQGHLMAEILDDLADRDPDGVFSDFVRLVGSDDIETRALAIAKTREHFGRSVCLPDILKLYGAARDTSEEGILAAIDTDSGLLQKLLAMLPGGSSGDRTVSKKLSGLNLPGVEFGDLETLEGVFLYGSGTKTPFGPKLGAIPTKKGGLREALGADLAGLDEFMERLAEQRPNRVALQAARRTSALHRFAGVLLLEYEAQKMCRGWLDFDDLVLRAAALLDHHETAGWIRYRLDGGIDHILVDESQDTSPVQWQVIDHLAREFSAGAGARDGIARTLFVVGDRKQSIYSFQGADALEFDRRALQFRDRMRSADDMQELRLDYSFRSSRAVLDVVDATFAGPEAVGLGGPPTHHAFHESMPGRVDLWPLIPKSAEPEPGAWSDPVDMVAEGHHSSLLAERIADEIRRMVGDPETSIPSRDGTRRRVTEGDILILVKKRTGSGDLFQSIIRACKSRGLAVAGADRLKLESELAVKDLRALLSFVALPEDDLSLAAALRSPLFGWSEDDLFRLADGRGDAYLWQALRKAADAHPETMTILADLRRNAEFLRPYELLERTLQRHGGRSNLLARLGTEAEDGIDELLNLALVYEHLGSPSLTGFLAWLEREDSEIKRHLEQGGGKIRVMTVHGAKGLEAPIVILPDTMRDEGARSQPILVDEDGFAHVRPARDARPPVLAELAASKDRAEALERQRLLYVAMTRAQSWLIVCGAGELGKNPVWYSTVAAGLGTVATASLSLPFGEIRRFESGDWKSGEVQEGETEPALTAALPDWAGQPCRNAGERKRTLSPSDLGGARALAGDGQDEESALRAGRQMHLLLEHLPAVSVDRRGDVAVNLLSLGEDALDVEAACDLAGQASALIEAPNLQHLFHVDALTEVEISANLPELGGRRIHGVIDRAILREDKVLIVDFKTNIVIPTRVEETPEGILRQMGSYLAAAQQIWPDRQIETAILWTRNRVLMPLPHDIVMAALRRTTIS